MEYGGDTKGQVGFAGSGVGERDWTYEVRRGNMAAPSTAAPTHCHPTATPPILSDYATT